MDMGPWGLGRLGKRMCLPRTGAASRVSWHQWASQAGLETQPTVLPWGFWEPGLNSSIAREGCVFSRGAERGHCRNRLKDPSQCGSQWQIPKAPGLGGQAVELGVVAMPQIKVTQGQIQVQV
jgi:hypothetical protein